MFAFIYYVSIPLEISAAKSADAQAPIPDAPESLPPKGPGWPPAVKDNKVFAHVLFDQLEGRASTSGTLFRWDGQGWLAQT